jgi:hypothetical protein
MNFSRFKIAVILGLLAAIPLAFNIVGIQPLSAQTPTEGGFPSRPTFQNVTIRGASPALTLKGLAVGAASTAYEQFTDSAGTRIGYVGDAGASDTNITLDSDSGTVRLVTNGGAHSAVYDGTGTLSLDGVAVAAFADSGTLTWSFSTGQSTCTVSGTNATFVLHKIAPKAVMGTILGSGSCTIAAASSQGTTNAPVPAAFRPATGTSCGAAGNGVSITGGANVTGSVCVNPSGNINLMLVSATTPTNVTTIGINGTNSFYYTLD